MGFGFLTVFKIFFSNSRVFQGLMDPMITMLAMMTGELDTVAKLFPQTTKLYLVKNFRNSSLTNELQSEYKGKENPERHYLQFAG